MTSTLITCDSATSSVAPPSIHTAERDHGDDDYHAGTEHARYLVGDLLMGALRGGVPVHEPDGMPASAVSSPTRSARMSEPSGAESGWRRSQGSPKRLSTGTLAGDHRLVQRAERPFQQRCVHGHAPTRAPPKYVAVTRNGLHGHALLDAVRARRTGLLRRGEVHGSLAMAPVVLPLRALASKYPCPA